MLTALTVCLAATCLLLACFYRRRKSQQNVFAKMGIPGPKPHFILGNMAEFKDKPMHVRLQEWTRTFGNLFGYYEGPTPVLVCSNLDFLKEVFIKQFNNFHGRKPFFVDPDPDKCEDVHMFGARGNRWKRLRSIVSPTFSAHKMKQMSPMINEKANVLLKKLDRVCENKEEIDIYGYFQGLTLDVIGNCLFGMNVDSQEDCEGPFLKHTRQVFKDVVNPSPLILIPCFFPALRQTIRRLLTLLISLGKVDSYSWVQQQLFQVVNMRKQDLNNNNNNNEAVDFVQLMLNVEDNDLSVSEEASLSVQSDLIGNKSHKPEEIGSFSPLVHDSDKMISSAALHQRQNSIDGKKPLKRLTHKEIVMQSSLFLLAGYETTSTALAYASYELALNPHVQAKLQQEIDQHMSDDEIPTYERVRQMKYLDMVLNETLRKYPVASLVVARECLQECTVQGYTVPKGTIVQADLWSMHYDQDVWGPEDTQAFVPERFTDERKAQRHPMAWMPFGAGPRNCVGLRFAMLEAKYTLCKILKKFNIEKCDKTLVPLPLLEAATIQPKEGVTVRITARTS